MFDNARVLGSDPFSIDGEPHWVNVHWGFQLIAEAVHRIAGFDGLSIMKSLLAALIMLVFGLSLRRHVSAGWLMLCGILTLLLFEGRIRARPEAFTLLYIMLTIAALESVRRGGSPRKLWLLAPLMMVRMTMRGI